MMLRMGHQLLITTKNLEKCQLLIQLLGIHKISKLCSPNTLCKLHNFSEEMYLVGIYKNEDFWAHRYDIKLYKV